MLTRIQRRRKQVCKAQRAYRARNEAHTKALQERVARLEAALERTGRVVIEFTDILIEARVLSSHQQLAHHLRDTVKTCLDSALLRDDGREEIEYSKGAVPLRTPSSLIAERTNIGSEDARRCLSGTDHTGLSVLLRSPQRSPASPHASVRMVEVSTFVDQLRITCLYQGFLMLNNPSVPLEALRRPFHLLLSLVTRETITSFFHMCLYARLKNQEPQLCREIPCFKIGGAGTHFPKATGAAVSTQIESGQQDIPPTSQQPNLSAIDATDSMSSRESRKDLKEDWFDLLDLMGYLRAHSIVLSMEPPSGAATQRAVNVMNFTAGESLSHEWHGRLPNDSQF